MVVRFLRIVHHRPDEFPVAQAKAAAIHVVLLDLAGDDLAAERQAGNGRPRLDQAVNDVIEQHEIPAVG
jgi:hypothetical protein